MNKLYGVIGNPIAHSLSPLMHNLEFRQLGIDAFYQPFRIKEEELETAVRGMKAIGVEGFNVTVPHKTAIIPFLDEVDPLAKEIGAVNTVVRKNGRFVGYNTDGDGFVEALLEEWNGDISTANTLIIGAGGAAKAIYYTLQARGMKKVDLANRTVEKAQQLIKASPFEGESKALSLAEAENKLQQYELIIQTTAIGMTPDEDKSPISVSNLQASTFVSDIIYNPFKTKLLLEAEQKGAAVQNGLGMFIYQGALAFEKWTGRKPDIARMKKTVTQHLGGQ